MLEWLRSRDALIDDKDPLALLQRIARVGRSGRFISSALTESQLARLRDAFEAIPADEHQALGLPVGKAIQLTAYTFDKNKKEIATICSPAKAYLPRSIDKDPDSFAVAAGRTAGLYWVSGKYAHALKSSQGRLGLGAQKFLRLLGAETAPHVVRHSQLSSRYSDPRKGLHISIGPRSRIDALQAKDADYTLDDWESVDLQSVVLDISTEKRSPQRRERAGALLATLARAWDRLEHAVEVPAALANYQWNTKGAFRAYWLWEASHVEWLDDAKSKKRLPSQLRLRTPAAMAIYGSEGSNYLRADLYAPVRQRVLEALGVQGEASTSELIRRLRELRAGAANAHGQEVAADAAAVYQALAARFPQGRPAQDMTSRALIREFSDVPGLILTRRGWRRPHEVLVGPPAFGNYRDYVPAIMGAENLWRALQVPSATLDQCLTVMHEVAQRRRVLEGEERAVIIDTLKLLPRVIPQSGLDATTQGRMRKVPLWTSLGWSRTRPVYAISDPSIAHALSARVSVWDPGCEISVLSACLEPLGIKLVTAIASKVLATPSAHVDEAATALFRTAVSHLHDDLSRNESLIAAGLSVLWDTFKSFKVMRDPELRVRLSGVEGWDENDSIAVRAKAQVEELTLYVREASDLGRVDAGGRAIAALFNADPRKVAHAWRAACDKADKGLTHEEFVAAEETQKLEAEEIKQQLHARMLALQSQAKNRNASTKAQPATTPAAPKPSVLPAAGAAPLAPRVLVDPNTLRVKQPQGRIVERDQPPSKSEKKSTPLVNPRSGNGTPKEHTSLPTFSGQTKESLALGLVRRALAYDDEQLRDIRAQLGVGADAVDDLGQFFELKAYLHAEPDAISLTQSEFKRAATSEHFYLAVVSQLEGASAKPSVRIIADPVNQLAVADNASITMTGVRHAASLVFEFEPGAESASGEPNLKK